MLIGLVIALVAAFALLCTYLYFAQGRMIFVPSRDLVITPDMLDLTYEDVYIEVVTGEKVNGWYFPVCDSGKTVLFCHGNAGNISHRLETVAMLVELGVNVFLFDYRGYGLSDGSPSEENVYADAGAAYRWLLKEKGIAADRIILFGRSLGGAVAIELAGRVDYDRLIVESSFTSATDLGRRMLPYLPIATLIRYHFDSVSRIGLLNRPILVVHSPEDDLIPYEMGRRLYEHASEPKRFLSITGGHNDRDYLHHESYLRSLSDFLGSV